MKKLLLSAFVAISFASSAQTTIFSDDFESYQDFAITGFGNWVTVDVDAGPTYIGGTDYGQGEWAPDWANSGDPMAWQIFNPSNATGTVVATGATEPIFNVTDPNADETRNFDPHSGSKYAASWATVTASAPNNDWLISPPIQLGTSGNAVKFWVKELSDSYGDERYNVYIYTGAAVNAPTATNFTAKLNIGAAVAVSNFMDWTEATYNLAATYNSQLVRIGIRNVGNDVYMLQVDDFSVTTTGSLNVNAALAAKFAVYPNPANNVININSSDAIALKNIQITDLNGRVVKSADFDGVAEAQINVADLASGVYMMNISSAEGVAVKKIVRN